MSYSILKVDGIGKRYRLGMFGSGTLYEDLNRWWNRVRGKRSGQLHNELDNELNKSASGFVWALQNISLNVKKGEVIGIIGRNGAGKSTLLKLLSKVTGLTTGSISYNGRIASLLEVGTGFHPELTGRENIFLNGAILGMSRREVENKLDDIIEFSGVAKYIDTPVKRYSSGMYVRLAFSVAAHLEAEILVVDEVLAVGDTAFQKKCADKMLDIARGGRTILFVSHNMASVRSICSKAIVLEEGRKLFEGDVAEAIEHYNNQNHQISNLPIGNIPRKRYGKKLVFNYFSFESNRFRFGKPITFTFKLKALKKSAYFKKLDIGVNICDSNSTSLIHIANRFLNKDFEYQDDETEYEVTFQNNLKPGVFYLTLFLANDEEIFDLLEQEIQFEIEDGNPYNFENTSNIQGVVLPEFDIKINRKI